MVNTNYRPELDGIRALAIIPVVLFHLDHRILEQGYLGVDIFFVLSGYLIASNSIALDSRGAFRISHFYIRRVRRLAPALLLMVGSVVTLSYWQESNSSFRSINQSAIAAIVSLSNIYFYVKTDYFSPINDILPLLHTWSLGVEEQFYLFFPFVFIFLRHKRRVIFTLAIFIIGMCSLLLFALHYRSNPMMSFYLPTHRFWEIACGILVALLPIHSHTNSSWSTHIIGVLLSIILFIFVSPESTFNNSWLIYLSLVLSVSMVIHLLPHSQFFTIVLSCKPLVWIGTLSYSLYLWHQPVIFYLNDYGASTALILCFVVTFSFLSYRFECWARHCLPEYGVQIALFFVAVTVVFVIFLIYLYSIEGNAGRFSPAQQQVIKQKSELRSELRNFAYDRYGCFLDLSQNVSEFRKNDCVEEYAEILLIGDSEAAHLSPALPIGEFSQLTMAGCRPIPADNITARCGEFFPFISSVIEKLPSTHIILVASNWNVEYLKNDQEFTKGIHALFSLLKKSSSKVLVVNDLADFIEDPFELFIDVANGHGGLFSAPVIDNSAASNLLSSVAQKYDIDVVNVDIFCSAPKCIFKDHEYLYYDRNHLTPAGSRRFFRIVLSEKLKPIRLDSIARLNRSQ